MREILPNPFEFDGEEWPGIREVARGFRENPPIAVATPGGQTGTYDPETGEYVHGAEPAPEDYGARRRGGIRYRYESAKRGLPVLQSELVMLGKQRVDFIKRQAARARGEVKKEPQPTLTSITNSKLNEHRIIRDKEGVLRTRYFSSSRILSWSLPARETCPGKSAWCDANCYAAKGRFDPNGTTPNVYWGYVWHWRLIEEEPKEVRAYMLEEIRKNKAEAFRIHPSGDFYSIGYLNWWIDTIRAIHERFPKFLVWCYTRMWDIDRLRQIERDRDSEFDLGTTADRFIRRLRYLYRMPNVILWASMDPTMPLPPPKWRRAWIDTTPAKRPARVDPRAIYVEAAGAWLTREEARADPELYRQFQLQISYLRTMPDRVHCPSQRWSAAWEQVKDQFPGWPVKTFPPGLPPEIEKALGSPRTCESCMLCARSQMRNIIFGQH